MTGCSQRIKMALHHRHGETLGSGGVIHLSAVVWFEYYFLAQRLQPPVIFLSMFCFFLPLFIDCRKEEREGEEEEEVEVDEPGCISMRCEISHSRRLPGLRHGSVHGRVPLMKCAHEFVFFGGACVCSTHCQGGLQYVFLPLSHVSYFGD